MYNNHYPHAGYYPPDSMIPYPREHYPPMHPYYEQGRREFDGRRQATPSSQPPPPAGT